MRGKEHDEVAAAGSHDRVTTVNALCGSHNRLM
jgi:hypothetical protein